MLLHTSTTFLIGKLIPLGEGDYDMGTLIVLRIFKMTRCLVSMSGHKEYQNMAVKAVEFLCMNTTGNMVDGNLYSTRETIQKHEITEEMIIGLPCVHTIGIATDGWLHSKKETMISMIVVDSQIDVLNID